MKTNIIALAGAVFAASAFLLSSPSAVALEKSDFIITGGVGYQEEYIWRGIELQDDIITPEVGINYIGFDTFTLGASVAGYLSTDEDAGPQDDEWNFTLSGSLSPIEWLDVGGGVTQYYITDAAGGTFDLTETFVSGTIDIYKLLGIEDGLLFDGEHLAFSSAAYFSIIEDSSVEHDRSFEQILSYIVPVSLLEGSNISLLSRWGYRDIAYTAAQDLDYLYYGLGIDFSIPLNALLESAPESISIKPNVRYDSADYDIAGVDEFRNLTWGFSISGTF